MRPVEDYQDLLAVSMFPLFVGPGHVPDDRVLPVLPFHQYEREVGGRGSRAPGVRTGCRNRYPG